MSPILAAQIIPANLQLFDAVIFDEASQIPPAEAIGSLARAPQAVIVGDSRQLPPTSFFGPIADDDGDDEDDDLLLTKDIESLLDAAGTLLRDKMLQWHYRSRDDRLIAFSNNHIYGGSLTAFPGAIVCTPITHYLIPFRPITSVSGTRSNPDEVKKVVELILEHARETPNETLGVIAFGQHHAGNIDNQLLRRLSEVDDSYARRVFLRNRTRSGFSSRTSSASRAMNATTSYSVLATTRTPTGTYHTALDRFSQEGGERRLNVAVTRARSRLTLVSSFSHRDMEPGRSSAKGVVLLRQYLEYAASGGENLGSDVSDVPLNPFELSVKDGLERRGIPVTPTIRRLWLSHRTLPVRILTSLDGWCSPSRPMALVTTPRTLHVTETAFASKCSRARVGASTVSGRPHGSVTARRNSTRWRKRGNGLSGPQTRMTRR